jgi:hypothetical protein
MLPATPVVADAPTSVTFQAEAWYQPDPACTTPAGCATAPPPSSPYPAGTLHVAADAGQETARSYLALAPTFVPSGATLTSAQLIIPVDADTTANGSLQPDTATLQACVSFQPVTSAEGSFSEPPSTDCSHAVALHYGASPQPTFSADVTPLLAGAPVALANGAVSLAILPAAPAPAASWHVVFSTHDRASPPTPPASLLLSFTSGVSTGIVTPVTSQGVGNTSTVTVRPPDFSVPSVPPTVSRRPTAPSLAPQIANQQPVAAVQTPRLIAYQYPEALLIPFALALLGWVIVKVMTGDLNDAGVSGSRP